MLSERIGEHGQGASHRPHRAPLPAASPSKHSTVASVMRTAVRAASSSAPCRAGTIGDPRIGEARHVMLLRPQSPGRLAAHAGAARWRSVEPWPLLEQVGVGRVGITSPHLALSKIARKGDHPPRASESAASGPGSRSSVSALFHLAARISGPSRHGPRRIAKGPWAGALRSSGAQPKPNSRITAAENPRRSSIIAARPFRWHRSGFRQRFAAAASVTRSAGALFRRRLAMAGSGATPPSRPRRAFLDRVP